MAFNKANPQSENRLKIHQILTCQVQKSPVKVFVQNSENIKLQLKIEYGIGTPLKLTRKTIDQHINCQNLNNQKLYHRKQGSLEFVHFQQNNDTKKFKFNQIRSSRSQKINQLHFKKKIDNNNNCYQENINETMKPKSQFQIKEVKDEKILDLLLLNTMELKEMLSVNKEKPLKKQRIKPKINIISNTKSLPHDFFLQQ